jgi:hypothetical protein
MTILARCHVKFQNVMDLSTRISVHVLTCFVNYYDKNHCKTIMRLQATKSIAMGSITNFYYTGCSRISVPKEVYFRYKYAISPTC